MYKYGEGGVDGLASYMHPCSKGFSVGSAVLLAIGHTRVRQ